MSILLMSPAVIGPNGSSNFSEPTAAAGGAAGGREAARAEEKSAAARSGVETSANAGDGSNETAGAARVGPSEAAGAARADAPIARNRADADPGEAALRVSSIEAAVRAAVIADPLGDAKVEAAARAMTNAPANDLDMQGLIYSISKPLDAGAETEAPDPEAARKEAVRVAAAVAAANAERFETGVSIVRGDA